MQTAPAVAVAVGLEAAAPNPSRRARRPKAKAKSKIISSAIRKEPTGTGGHWTWPTGHITPSTPSAEGKSLFGRTPNIQMGQHWKPDAEFYDYQTVNGLPLPRVIRSSNWSQVKDIEGCDPLTVPLSKLLYQGSENFWLERIATATAKWTSPLALRQNCPERQKQGWIMC